MRLHSKSLAASAYLEKNEETTRVVKARKAVVEPMLMIARMQLRVAVVATLYSGRALFGSTCS